MVRHKLYHYWRSSASWRVRWALELKKVSVDYIPVNLLDDSTDRPEFRKISPMGFVPVLEIPLRGDSVHLIESLPIIEWLDETIKTPTFLPGSSIDRARIRALAEIINAGTQPLGNIPAQDLHTSDPEEKKKWVKHWTHNGLSTYETLVKQHAGRFSFGDTITLADLFLIPQVYNAHRFEVSLDSFPTVKRIYDEALKTPECQNTHPSKFEPKPL